MSVHVTGDPGGSPETVPPDDTGKNGTPPTYYQPYVTEQPKGPYYPYPNPPQQGGYYYPGIPPRPMIMPTYRKSGGSVVVGLVIFFVALIFITVLGGILFTVFALNGFNWDNGPLTTSTATVALNNATQAQVDINKGVGNLTVSGGAENQNLMNATYTYNNSRGVPDVNYNVSGTTGNLSIRQPDGNFFGTFHNDWDLKFKNGTPLDFRFELGVGNTTLNMAGLSLSGLNVKAGVGNTIINLNGITPVNFNGNINGGVGNITIRVPQDIGVQVTVSQGLGKVQVNGLRSNGNTYYNDAFGTTTNVIRLNVNSGIGNIVIEH